MSFKNMPLFRFCLANNLQTTHGRPILRQLGAILMYIRKASFPSIVRRLRWYTWKFILPTFTEKYRSTTKLQRSVTPHSGTLYSIMIPTSEQVRHKRVCDLAAHKTVKAKTRRTVTYLPSNRLPDDIVSYLTQSVSTTTLRTKRGSVKCIQTSTEMQNKREQIAKPNIRLLAPNGLYVPNEQYDDDLQDVVSFFLKKTYRVWVWTSVTLNPFLTIARSLDTGASPNLIKQDFLPLASKESVKSIKAPQCRTANRKVVSNGIVAPLIRIVDLRVGAWFEIVENMAIYVLLGTWYIDRHKGEIFQTERQIVPSHLRALGSFALKTAIIRRKTAINTTKTALFG